MKNLLKESWFWIIGAALVIALGILFIGNPMDLFQGNTALTVDGQEYSRSDFDNLVEKTASQYETYGMEVTKEELKDQAVEQAVQEILLTDLAKEKDVEVTEEDIQEFTEELMTMYEVSTEEDLVSMLKEQGLKDKEEMDTLFSKQVEIDKLIELYSEDIEVTEEEVENYYEVYKTQAQSSGQEVPPFEEIREEIRPTLIQERATELILEDVEEMKEDAEIEVFITDEDIEAGTVTDEDSEGEEESEGEEDADEEENEEAEEGQEEVNPEDMEIEIEE